MPQRPRAHLSGVAAENDHWLRRSGLRFHFRLPRQYLFASGIYLERGSQPRSVKIESPPMRKQGATPNVTYPRD